MLSKGFLCMLLSSVLYCSGVHVPGQYQPSSYDASEQSQYTGQYAFPSTPYQRAVAPPSKTGYEGFDANLYQQRQSDQLNSQQNLHQYFAALRQFQEASGQAQQQQNTFASPDPSQVPQRLTQQQAAGGPQPLGILYSAATDVSHFRFNGNGVNYSF